MCARSTASSLRGVTMLASRSCGDDLLTDLDDDWVLEERRAHRERVGELLVVVGEAAEQAGDLGAAVRHARRRLELDPVSEDAARDADATAGADR